MWRTVVFAGAMLAVPGIATAQDPGAGTGTASGSGPGSAEPANPPKKIAKKKKKKKKKKKRPRVVQDPCGGKVGRGFILS
jgi:hypothetical protein